LLAGAVCSKVVSGGAVPIKTPREHYQDSCHVTPEIRERHGLYAALGYIVGDKLMTFAQTAETDEGFRSELPAFCKKIRTMFTKTEIEGYFETSELDSRIESDLFVGANAEETAELQEIVDDANRDRERRTWVKAMLTQSGS
jgi:hypothetical protein